MYPDHDWYERTYDEVVQESGDDGLQFKQAREECARRYEEAVQSGDLVRPSMDSFAEGLDLFDKFVRPARNARRASLPSELDHIIAAIHDETLLGHDDPRLRQAFPLGNGFDKIIGAWTPDDFSEAVMTRYRKSAEITGAAQEMDNRVSQIVAPMKLRGAKNIFGLFPPAAEHVA